MPSQSADPVPRESGEVVLRPPRILRRLAYVPATAGVLVIAAAAYMFWIDALVPGLCVVFMGVVAAGTAVPILMGQVVLSPRGLLNKQDSFSSKFLAWDDIEALELRRRLWTETVVAVGPPEPVTLGAPIRPRLGRDPWFEAAVDDLSRRAGVGVTRGRGLLTWRYALTYLAILAAWTLVFVTFDPIWHHDVWPGRKEAHSLPDPCRVLQPTAKRLLPKHTPARFPFPDNPECQYGAISMMLQYRRYEYAIGQDGGIEQAKESFREGPGGPTPDDKGSRPLPGLGDEATIVTSTLQGGARLNQVQISVRKGNVVIWLSYTPRLEGRDSTDEAVAIAERLARAAAAAIILE